MLFSKTCCCCLSVVDLGQARVNHSRKSETLYSHSTQKRSRWYQSTLRNGLPCSHWLTNVRLQIEELNLSERKPKHKTKRYRCMTRNNIIGIIVLSWIGSIVLAVPSQFSLFLLRSQFVPNSTPKPFFPRFHKSTPVSCTSPV